MVKSKYLSIGFSLSILFLTVGLANATITGLTDVTTYNGHTYGITNVISSWHDAEAFAVTQGGHLVTINDAAEDSFLYSQYVNPVGAAGTSDFWIGLYAPDATQYTVNDVSLWKWVSGDTSTYRNWRNGQPDVGYGGNPPVDAYGAIGFGGSSQWDNYPEGWWQPKGIVEIDAVSAPEPTTMLLLGFGLIGLAGIRRKIKQ
jgi:hypothetical protein